MPSLVSVLLFAGLGLAAALGLIASISRLVATLRGSIEAEAPLREHMQFELAASGPKVVYFKGARLINLSNLALTLRANDGTEVALHRILVPFTWSGTDVRISYAHCQIPKAGSYAMSAAGIPDSTRPMSILISRPIALRSVALIVAIVLCAGTTIAAVVLAVLSSTQ